MMELVFIVGMILLYRVVMSVFVAVIPDRSMKRVATFNRIRIDLPFISTWIKEYWSRKKDSEKEK